MWFSSSGEPMETQREPGTSSEQTARAPTEAPAHPPPLSKREIAGLVTKPDPLILEIGCNDGTDTLEFLDVFPDCTIHCFECDPRPIAKFRARVRDSRCTLHEVALADADSTAVLHMSGGTRTGADRADWDMSSSLLPPKEHLVRYPWVTFERECLVRTMRLDTWAEGLGSRSVDFIWMDVQGAEHLVIKGGQQTLRDRTRWLYFEYYNREMYTGQNSLAENLELLPGYRLIATYGRNALAVNETTS
jgi:FkbM family methyltransferase